MWLKPPAAGGESCFAGFFFIFNWTFFHCQEHRSLPVTGLDVRAGERLGSQRSVADLVEYFPPLLNEHQHVNTQGVAGGGRYIEDMVDRGKPVTDGIIMDI